jgi:tape measure domain-containing protein
MSEQHYKVIISADGKQMRGEFQRLSPSIKNTNTQLAGTQRQAQAAGNALSYTTSQGDLASASLRKVGHYGTAMFAGFQFSQLIKGAINTTATLQDLETRMRSLSGTSVAYAANRQYLIELGESHHKTMVGLSGAYADLLALEQNQIVTTTEARGLLQGMSNAASALGTSNAQLEQSFYGLAQGLASPIVSMEEIKQTTDPMPGLFQKIEKAAGLTGGELRELAASGAITSQFFKENLLKALQEFDGEAAKTHGNISAHTRDLNREYELFISMLDTPIGAIANTSLDALAGTLAFLRENSDLAMGAVLLFTARGTVGLGNLTAAKLKSIAATHASRAADAAAAIEARNLAAAELGAAQSALAKANAQNSGTIGITKRISMQRAATERLTIAQRSYNSAANSASIATGNLATKARLLRGVGALLGGPVGVFTLAATAIAAFASSARSGAPDIANLKREVDLLLGNNAAVRQSQITDQITKHNVAVKKLTEQYQLFNALSKTGRTKDREHAKQRAGEVGEKLKAVQAQVVLLEAELNKPKAAANGIISAGTAIDPREKIKADKATAQAARLQKLSEQAFERLQYELLSEEEKIKSSYEKRKQIIIANTEEGSQKRVELMRESSHKYIDALREVYEQEKQLENEKNAAVVASAKEAAQKKREALMGSAASMGQIFGNMSSILMQGNKKQFEQGKKFAQAQAAISGSLAIIKAFTAGPILGPILATTIGALTAIQMAKINQQQYQPVAHGGMTYNPDERSVTITKGERVVSPRQNQDLMQFLGKQNSGGVNKKNLVQNFHFSSNDPAAAAQMITEKRGILGSYGMKAAS